MSHHERIIVPQRIINGGFDFKFESDPYDLKLHGLMTRTRYTDTITQLNDRLRPSRSKTIDTVLLSTGVLMVPLAMWGVRHKHLTKKRKKILLSFIDEFNATNESLWMRWNRRPQSFLSIERRREEESIEGETMTMMDKSPLGGGAVPPSSMSSSHSSIISQGKEMTSAGEEPKVSFVFRSTKREGSELLV